MTTNLDEYLHPRDIRDSHVLTRIIEKRVQESEVYNVPFAPFFTTTHRKVKLKVREFDPAGLASFKADNANTPVVGGGGEVREIYLEMAAIAEKHVLKATDIIALESPDPAVAEGAARDILKLGQQLRIRNMQRTKWMAWKAAQDLLVITYPNGVSIQIDYDLDGNGDNSDFSGSHKPTASVAWNHQDGDVYDADVPENVYDWTKLIADDLGVDPSECILHINAADWRYVKKNKHVRGELSSTQPRIITPILTEVAAILGVAAIKLVNDFWKDTDGTKYKFLPDGAVLITAPYEVNGTPIMEMYDGPVVRVVGDDLVVAPNPGALSEIYINKEQITKNIRVQTARLPVMNYPAAFVWADIGTGGS